MPLKGNSAMKATVTVKGWMNVRAITTWNDVPIVMDLPMASRIVGLSYECLKKRAQRGDFPAYKEGKQWRVNKAALRKHVGLGR